MARAPSVEIPASAIRMPSRMLTLRDDPNWQWDLNRRSISPERSCVNSPERRGNWLAQFEHNPWAVTLVPTMRKPVGVLAEGLVSSQSRGDRTPLELVVAGVRGLPAAVPALLCQAATGEARECALCGRRRRLNPLSGTSRFSKAPALVNWTLERFTIDLRTARQRRQAY
jgi:hypothetical protein